MRWPKLRRDDALTMTDPKDWAADVTSLVEGLGKNLLGVAAHVVHAVVGTDPFEIIAYRGYGNGARAHVYGRVIEKRDIGASTGADSVLKNLYNTYRRADSDPLPMAHVEVEYADTKLEMSADNEGFFGGWIELATATTDEDEWQKYSVELIRKVSTDTPTAPVTVKASGEIIVPPQTARFGVISDIDDTVIQSRVSNFLQAARTVILGNARTRLPFPGVAGLYQALRNGATGDEKNPIFYVSGSPWNIHDVITEFMDLQKIPKGPLILRDWDIGWRSLSSLRRADHKDETIRNIFKLYPNLEFILVGDTGQQDPEIYSRIVHEFPTRVRAIYIRDVTRTAERSASVKKLADEVLAAHSTLVLVEDSLSAASHAVQQGWISADALPNVREEKRADEGEDDTKVAAPAVAIQNLPG